MEYEELRVKLQTIQAAVEELKNDLAKLSYAISVLHAANDSLSQSKSEKPSGPRTCGSTESAPRKVWAVMYGDYGNRDQSVYRVYASREAAQNYVDAEGDEDTTITEYEVTDD